MRDTALYHLQLGPFDHDVLDHHVVLTRSTMIRSGATFVFTGDRRVRPGWLEDDLRHVST